MSSGFVHLHVHSDYSVLDGACKTKELLDRCEKYGMEACALTDHGNLFGAVEFYQMAKARGIKPIIGCELYVAPGDLTDTRQKYLGKTSNHFLMLCENVTGYHNLCKLSSKGYLEGFYYKPRVDDALLAKHSEGLIATTSCLAGRVPQAILQDDMDLAVKQLERYIEIFGKDNFLVELMHHGIEEQEKVDPALRQLAEDYDLMVIATNDCHYIDKADAEAHEALLCVQTGTTLEDEKRFRFSTQEFYFRTEEEMREAFKSCPEAVDNTLKVAARCNLEIPLGESLIPAYYPDGGYVDGATPLTYLTDLVTEGLKVRYGETPDQVYLDRAEFELGIIERMKFVDYFLVVWDLIRFANQEGIPVGPGRGSGAGSIVAYTLYITNIDPMKYNLLFERFLNPERVSMPDFDIDFCYNRREEMIAYTYEKYGRENVSQIITFGRMLAKNVIRNVGRVLGMSYGDVDHIAKLVPDELKIKLKDAEEKVEELRLLIAEDPQVNKLWRLAKRLEGTIGNCGTHAAGVVICDHDLTDHVALYKASNSDTVATQVEMKCVEEVGLLKMDFLGLRTLTVVHEAVRLIKEGRGVEIDIDNISCDDNTTYELLRSGQTTGVFQLESSGMRDLAKRIGLQSLEEVSALVALFRPGPMQFIDQYIEGKYKPESIQYDHPLTKPILEETYGIAVYQEQVMQLVQACGGFSRGQADMVRRAMGKKKKDLLDQQKVKFVEGCAPNGIDEKLAGVIWDKIETFAGYGFNKSHSVAYAFVAYQTAYLKANYPVEFMCALLTSESGNLDKVALYVDECRRMGIDVLAPDINESWNYFAVAGKSIRFGMGAIKNVGEGPTEEITRERTENGPFTDLFDMCKRLDTRMVNRRCVESLNKAGAFAGMGWNRKQVEAALDQAMGEGQSAQRDRDAGQFSLFDMDGMEDTMATMHQKPDLPEYPDHEVLQQEKEMLGLYISSHPLDPYNDIIDRFGSPKLADLSEYKEGETVKVAGSVATVRIHITKTNKRMAFVALETRQGLVEVTVFSDTFEEKAGLIAQDMIVMIPARVNYRNDEPGLVANDVFAIEDSERKLVRAVHVKLEGEALGEERVRKLAELLGNAKGTCDVYLHCTTGAGKAVTIHATEACLVPATRQFCYAIEEIVGMDKVWFSGGMGLPTHRPEEIYVREKKPWERKKKPA
ncbi:MAG: DNA polymerase III subunit alpha [Candidatus Hydrogenedentes bacterium]|nr:DNA polymerase III subunit alpha [Candidatus Hydrogenedentota bacterium]